MSTNQTKNKDILKTISERFIKPKVTEDSVTEVKTETVLQNVEVTPAKKHIAFDVISMGKDYLIVEIEYDLNTMTSTLLSSTPLDNRVAGLSFQHGKSGLEGVVNRTKRMKEGKK